MPDSPSPPAPPPSPQQPPSSPPPRNRGTTAQLVKESPPAILQEAPSPDPTGSPADAPGSPPWSPSGADATQPSRRGDSKPDTPSSDVAKIKGELKKTLQGLTEEVVDLGSHGVHLVLTARQPLEQAAGVWKASEEEARDIAEPAVELMSGYIPPALLEKGIINAIRLGIAISKYVTSHLALRNAVNPDRTKRRIEQTRETQQ